VATIIIECCELVKLCNLCHINRSGPVFLRHSVHKLKEILNDV